jgi:hypothetical protein
MLKFNDFEVLNEKANYELPNRVDSLIKAFTAKEPTISVEPWPEKISKEGDKKQLLGIRMYLNDILFRINWREGSSEPDMIDIWDAGSKNEIMPRFSLIGKFELFKSLSQNIMQMVVRLANTKRAPMTAEVFESGLGEVNPKVVNAPPEQTDDVVQPEADLEADDMNVFDELRTLVIMVINNINPSLIITGRGGVGKTHTVIQTMKEFDIEKEEEYVVIKGASTPLSMYKALYFNNGKIVIFDDCDSIFKDADGVNILKAALDSYEEREISWLSKSTYDPNTESPTESRPVPNRFVFEGQMIFISNLRMNQIDNAVRTRSYTIEINVTENELFDIMEKNLVNILPNVDMTTKKEVFDFIKSEYKSTEESINVRTLIKAIKIRLSGAPNWKKLASKYA